MSGHTARSGGLRAAWFAMLLLAGCGSSGDPASDRLEPGSTAVIVTGPGQTFEGAMVDTTEGDLIYPRLAPGVKVTVGEDEGTPKSRTVKVVVESGRFKGIAGPVNRVNLRPVRP